MLEVYLIAAVQRLNVVC